MINHKKQSQKVLEEVSVEDQQEQRWGQQGRGIEEDAVVAKEKKSFLLPHPGGHCPSLIVTIIVIKRLLRMVTP
uniref:CTNNB1 binding N-teminal domain-containing protein n=1 Tax=Panagrellus redivivus TaxID=6233 RepID=A0A7E4UN87_PANRE